MKKFPAETNCVSTSHFQVILLCEHFFVFHFKGNVKVAAIHIKLVTTWNIGVCVLCGSMCYFHTNKDTKWPNVIPNGLCVSLCTWFLLLYVELTWWLFCFSICDFCSFWYCENVVVYLEKYHVNIHVSMRCDIPILSYYNGRYVRQSVRLPVCSLFTVKRLNQWLRCFSELQKR